jgi:two-component system NtrC family sensor kinase
VTVWLITGVLAVIAAAVAYRVGAVRATRGLHSELSLATAELNRRLTELFSLQELSYILAESIRLERIADQVARYVKRFIDCDGTLVAVADEEDGGSLRVLAAEGALASLAGSWVPEIETGLVGVAMRRGHIEIAEPTGGSAPQLIGDVRPLGAVVAPLAAHRVTIGAIAVTRNSDSPFAAPDLRLLSTAATHAAVALANARFVELIRVGKEQWETTFDALHDGVAVVDASGRIRRANSALAEMIRTPLTEVTGVPLGPALLGSGPEISQFFTAVREGERPAPLTRKSSDGSRVYRISASPLAGSEPDRWIVTLIEDVTDAKALEAQLIQTEKLAAVGQLVSGVAHELNNPLTSIVGLSEFLIDQPTTTTTERDKLKVIHEQAERAARIVRDLLMFARKGPRELGDVDLTDVTERAASLISYEVRLRKVDLELELAGGLPTVRGDRHQIQQVVLNLLTNAVQAVGDNPAERPRIVRVETAHRDDRVLLRVTDSGPGIPEELAPQIFDPFFTTKEPGEGTGLGLSITFGIVEAHGGTITVSRAPDGGAAFEVTLPAQATPSTDVPSPLRGYD